MEVILYSNVFTTHDNFIVNSQQPPTSNSDKRCDIVIRYLENGTQKVRILCFAECKRARTSQPFSLKALERQAKDYSELYLDSEQEIPFVYVATMAGAHIRLWTYKRGGTELVPFWGPDALGDWKEYKDVGNDIAGQEIEHCFGQMKRFPPTPHAGQSSHTYGTSSTVKPTFQASVLGYQASSSSYQAPTLGYQASSSSYQASTPGYQTSSSGYQAPASGYHAPAAKYQASLSSYQAPAPGYQTSSSGYQAPALDYQGDEDEVEDNQMEGSVKAQEAVEYFVVKVSRKTHTFKSDEFIFKDKKGKVRSTTQDEWKKITYNGRSAWRHHKYVCTEQLFD
ncbi:hypothetical protein G7Y89_g5498 [Cudoniella acicularis]|uniref:Uncharacterized protein n=1 Tax=Cudoniella acicularis TaxID=354080 RepID=A0A8H4RMC8_9HELO|nr:hypothetical protein G7Y89_g5498 [Cudoniella acicularis]